MDTDSVSRSHVSVRLPDAVIEKVDAFAVDQKLVGRDGRHNRSHALELLLSEGLEAVRQRAARDRAAKRRGAR